MEDGKGPVEAASPSLLCNGNCKEGRWGQPWTPCSPAFRLCPAQCWRLPSRRGPRRPRCPRPRPRPPAGRQAGPPPASHGARALDGQWSELGGPGLGLDSPIARRGVLYEASRPANPPSYLLVGTKYLTRRGSWPWSFTSPGPSPGFLHQQLPLPLPLPSPLVNPPSAHGGWGAKPQAWTSLSTAVTARRSAVGASRSTKRRPCWCVVLLVLLVLLDNNACLLTKPTWASYFREPPPPLRVPPRRVMGARGVVLDSIPRHRIT